MDKRKFTVVAQGDAIPRASAATHELNVLLEEFAIAQALGEFISAVLSARTAKILKGPERVWLDRFDARYSGQSAFHIYYSPHHKVQSGIASGNFFSKQLVLYPRELPAAIRDDVMSCIQELFTDGGFTVVTG